MLTTQITTSIVFVECHVCHTPIGLTRDHYDRAQASNRVSFFCPNGHEAVFTRTREQELTDELNRAKQREKWANASNTALRDQLDATQNSLRAHKAAKTRLRNRMVAGLCPCCRRSFQNLQRHMAGQHPDYGEKS